MQHSETAPPKTCTEEDVACQREKNPHYKQRTINSQLKKTDKEHKVISKKENAILTVI
jgi:hypothetical protein